MHCRIAAWPGQLPAFIITLPDTFAQSAGSHRASEQTGGLSDSIRLWAAEGSTSGFASAVRWQFERPAVGVAAAVQSELKRRLNHSTSFAGPRQAVRGADTNAELPPLTVTTAAQLVDVLAIVGSRYLDAHK